MFKRLDKTINDITVAFYSMIPYVFNILIALELLVAVVKTINPEYLPSITLYNFSLLGIGFCLIPYLSSSKYMFSYVLTNYKKLAKLKASASELVNKEKELNKNIESQVHYSIRMYGGLLNILSTFIFVGILWYLHTNYADVSKDNVWSSIVTAILSYWFVRVGIWAWCDAQPEEYRF